MNRITPSDYMRQYHALKVDAVDPYGKRVTATVSVTRYQTRAYVERDRLIAAVKKVIGIKSTPSLSTTSDWFAFAPGDPIGTTEPFYWQSIRRAFGFKASPAEVADVLRLACRLGRIGTKKDVAGQSPGALTMPAYALQNFSLDCNGFVGNYWGVSPEVDQSNWADISGKTEATIVKKTTGDQYWNGWVRAAVLTLPYIPLEPRRAASDVRSGDVVVVLKDGSYWSHIAVVEHVTNLGKDEVSWRVVEYGSSTQEKNFGTAADKHIKPFRTLKLVQGPNKKLGVGYQEKNKFKYVFAAPNSPFPPATIGRCGEEGV